MLRKLWQIIVLWMWPAKSANYRAEERSDVTEPDPELRHIPSHTPAESEPPVVTEISSNRHERRALERARRKYDKFVTPKGELPAKAKRETQQIKPRQKRVEVITPAESVHDAELLIADLHHENRNDLVAYKEAEVYGEFNFRDTILQQLERYFVYLERMKKHDPDAYGYYREVGATLLPYVAINAHDRQGTVNHPMCRGNTPLPDWFNQNRPSFGCFVYGADPETEHYEATAKRKRGYNVWIPKFMYFTKYKRPPPEIQMISGGDIYKMTLYWDRPFDAKIKYGKPQEFAIFVSSDGKEIIALRCCDTKWVEIHSRREKKSVNRTGHYTRGPALRKRDLGSFSVPKRAWHIPGEFEKWAKEEGTDVQHFLTELFKETLQRNEMAHYSMTRVAATKGDLTAVFSVNIHRTSYFFQDRDVMLTEDGTRKRIFHFVRPHVRSDGTEVKAHFRGMREFTWAGYDIKITIPGRDHHDLNELDVGSVDEYWWEKDEPYLDMPALGKKLKGWIDEGRGRRA